MSRFQPMGRRQKFVTTCSSVYGQFNFEKHISIRILLHQNSDAFLESGVPLGLSSAVFTRSELRRYLWGM